MQKAVQDGSFVVPSKRAAPLELEGAFKGGRVMVSIGLPLREFWEFEAIPGFKESAVWFFKKAFISWNLVTGNGHPMPTIGVEKNKTTGEDEDVLLCAEYLDYPILNAIVMGWYRLCSSAPSPLSIASSNGKLSPEASTPTVEKSSSQES